LFTSRLGIRALWWSLLLLGATTLLQVFIYLASGSVALLADTVHNFGDTLNSIPLLISLYLGRRLATKRYTHGFGRAEDIAGLFIVASIAFSAGYILVEAIQRLLNPQLIANSGWVALAAIVGFLGNEAVATLELSVGRRIGSEAMVIDGRHARIDGLTSLAVLPAVLGSALGVPILDPVFAILIGIAILFITRDAILGMWYRLMDAVDPALTDKAHQALASSGKVTIHKLRLRWVGHHLAIEAEVGVEPGLSATEALKIIKDLKLRLKRELPNAGHITIGLAGGGDVKSSVTGD
jgi:cation diffusion facilitator family transporter